MRREDLKIIKDDITVYSITLDETILREDMYQAITEPFLIDCGWYENTVSGNFITYLIKNNDWDNPIIKIITNQIKEVYWSIDVCMQLINREHPLHPTTY